MTFKFLKKINLSKRAKFVCLSNKLFFGKFFVYGCFTWEVFPLNVFGVTQMPSSFQLSWNYGLGPYDFSLPGPQSNSFIIVMSVNRFKWSG